MKIRWDEETTDENPPEILSRPENDAEVNMEDPYEFQIHQCGKCYWRHIMTFPKNRQPKRPHPPLWCYKYKEMRVKCPDYKWDLEDQESGKT